MTGAVQLLPGVQVLRYGSDSLVWSPLRRDPCILDPIATVMLDVIDGRATFDELVADIVEEVGIDHQTASQQLTRVIEVLHRAGALAASEPDSDLAVARELFVQPAST